MAGNGSPWERTGSEAPFTSSEERRQQRQREREELARAANAAGAEVDGNPVYRAINDDELGAVVFWVVYDETGAPIRAGENTRKNDGYGYSLDGKLLSRATYDRDGKLAEKRQYDEHGYLISKYYYDADGRVETAIKYRRWGRQSMQESSVNYSYHPDGKLDRATQHTEDHRQFLNLYEYRDDGTLKGVHTTTLQYGTYMRYWRELQDDGTFARPVREDAEHGYGESDGTQSAAPSLFAYSGNPNLPYGYNPNGAVDQDGRPIHGFGTDPDVGTIWNSGHTAQGDPAYGWGYTGQGDPNFPFDPSNR